MTDWVLRPGRDADAAGFIALIGACWALYPGCILDVDGEEPHLRALASYYAGQGGALWVADQAGTVVGMIATKPLDGGTCEICKVYVAPNLHGQGVGLALLAQAEAHAIASGATRLALWSDTRFDRAHRFYEKHSYVRSGPIRVLHDISNSLEFAYAKPVNGIEVLDAAAAASAEVRLSSILRACVAEGAGVGFLPPLAPDVARRFWLDTAINVAAGTSILMAGWVGGVLAGTVTLALNTSETRPHCAEVNKLLVDPTARRAGLGHALMVRLEAESLRAGRTMLFLDTRAGQGGEAFYRTLGWAALGTVPNCVIAADGTLGNTAYFWKRLAAAESGPVATIADPGGFGGLA